MLKNLPYYVLVAIFACGFFLSLTPYPTFYNGTYNLSKTDISKINYSSEIESYRLDTTLDKEPTCVKLDWTSVNGLMDYNKPFRIIDIKSDIIFNACRIEGKNHADIRPCDEKDKLLLSGITENASMPRPCLVQIKQNVWASASLLTKAQSDKDGNTHFCLYFDGSCAHSTGQPDFQHQKMIDYAQKHGQETLKKLAL